MRIARLVRIVMPMSAVIVSACGGSTRQTSTLRGTPPAASSSANAAAALNAGLVRLRDMPFTEHVSESVRNVVSGSQTSIPPSAEARLRGHTYASIVRRDRSGALLIEQQDSRIPGRQEILLRSGSVYLSVDGRSYFRLVGTAESVFATTVALAAHTTPLFASARLVGRRGGSEVYAARIASTSIGGRATAALAGVGVGTSGYRLTVIADHRGLPVRYFGTLVLAIPPGTAGAPQGVKSTSTESVQYSKIDATSTIAKPRPAGVLSSARQVAQLVYH